MPGLTGKETSRGRSKREVRTRWLFSILSESTATANLSLFQEQYCFQTNEPSSLTNMPSATTAVGALAIALLNLFFLVNHSGELTNEMEAAKLQLGMQFSNSTQNHLASTLERRVPYHEINTPQRNLLRGNSTSRRSDSDQSMPTTISETNNTATFEQDDFMSACVLVLDENERLIEWVSYHYHVAKLRYLVVAVDPSSTTDPMDILKRWEAFGLKVILWKDEDFIQNVNETKRQEGNGPKTLYKKHRIRQARFYKQCTRHMIRNKHGWTLFTDPDEYLVLNRDIARDKSESDKVMARPGGLFREIQRLSRPGREGIQEPFVVHAENPESGDTVFNEEAMAAAAKHSGEPLAWFQEYAKPCVPLPRVNYNALESTEEEVRRDVPSAFQDDAKKFDTLRFRQRATPRGSNIEHGKTMVDLSTLTEADIPKRDRVVHRPIYSACPKSTHASYKDSPIGLHHYIGSWERFNARDDARNGVKNRRNYETWKSTANRNDGGADDEIRPWFKGFISSVGEENAKLLLEAQQEDAT